MIHIPTLKRATYEAIQLAGARRYPALQGTVFLMGCALLSAAASARAADTPTVVDQTFVARCDATQQRYLLMLPRDFAKAEPHDLLIALHGHGSNRWQIAQSGRGASCAAREVARERNMICVAPDYRAKTSWMGPKAEADLLQILAELRQRFSIGKVVICGGSMGGSSALTFAALHPDLIDGVAAMNATANHLEFENFQDAIATSFGGTKAQIPGEYKRRSAEYWPERLTMPVGLATGGKDTSVPPESVLRLAQILGLLEREPLLIHRPEAGHYTEVQDARRILNHVIDRAQQQASDRPAQTPSEAHSPG